MGDEPTGMVAMTAFVASEMTVTVGEFVFVRNTSPVPLS